MVHAAPPIPHSGNIGGDSQVLSEQHPLGQDAGLQTQEPPLHAWPAPHGEPEPHLQEPPTQLSALMPQLVQAPPPVPHAEGVGGDVQVDPEQQPTGQLDELHPVHTPPEHDPGLQSEHVAPPVPQSPGVLPG